MNAEVYIQAKIPASMGTKCSFLVMIFGEDLCSVHCKVEQYQSWPKIGVSTL